MFAAKLTCNSSVGSLEMPKSKAEHIIDLICTLCPNDPRFSDVSHLLTHISSKSHLSHLHKLQIKSLNDEASKTKLDTFEYWKHSNNIDTLLSERFSMKDKKKAKKSRASSVANPPVSHIKRLNSLSFDKVSWLFHFNT
jgi:hypothetical protein